VSREVAAPAPVRAAGALVIVQGLAALVVAVVALVHGIAGGTPGQLAYGEAGIFLVIAIAFAVPGVLLWLGRRGARNGVVFLQLLLVGGIWYQFNPAESLGADVVFTAYCLAVLVPLFLRPSRERAIGAHSRDGRD
jgi:hypothetical protein